MATPSSPTPLAFNHAQYATLASPGDKEMFIFKWLSALDAYLETQAAKNDVKAAQDKLEAILLEVAMIPQAGVTKSSSGRMSWLGGGQQQQNQQHQGKTLLGIVPKPTRVIRDLVSRCLARMYELGDVHRMGDALYAIQTTMQANRGTVDREARLASLVCAGVLFEALSTKAGFRLLSCFNDFVAITIKIIKTTKEPISIRVEATRTLGKLLQGGGGKTATEQQAKDVMKIVRPNLQHKSPLLVLASVYALHALVACTQFMRPGALPPFDAEAFVATTLVPLLANPVLVVRRAIARLVAVVIANNVTIGAPMQPPSIQQQQQQSQQGQQQGQMAADQARAARQSVAARTLGTADTAVRNSVDIYGVRSSSPQTPVLTATTNDANSRLSGDMPPALSKPTPPSKLASVSVSAAASATTLPSAGNEGEWRNTLGRALTWLSVPFTRASAPRELRAGIVDAYAAVIAELGSTVAEEHYGTICDHILVDLAAGTQIIAPEGADTITATAAAVEVAGGSGVSSDARVDAEILGLRNMCGWLLRVPLAQRLLTEQGKLVAAQWIWDRWLAGPLPPAMRALLEDDASAARGSASASARAWRAASPFAQSPQPRVAGAAAGGSGEVAVLVAIGEWRHLVEGLGEAVQALDIGKTNAAGGGNGNPEVAVVPLERWLAHPSDAMRVAAAAALGVLVQHDHAARASPVLASLGSRLQQLCAHCATSSSSSGTIATYIDPMRAAVGYAYGIAAVLSAGGRASPGPLMHLPLDLVEWVHGISIRLLAAAYHRTDPAVVGSGTGARSADPAGANAALGLGAGNGISSGGRSVGERKRPTSKANGSTADGDKSSRTVALTNMRMNVGWILATALASLGSDFVSTRVQAQWTPLWDAALPQPDAGSAGFVGGDTPWSMRAHLLQSRIMTLTQVLAYLRSASAELSESKLQRLGAAIRFALMFADNALDAPPSSSGAAFNPALPTRLLPCQTPVLSLHMMLRARIAECLDAITSSTTASHSGVIQGVVPAAVRLVETAIASPDNLCETFAARMAAAASRRLLRAATGDGARASTASAGSGSGDQEAATTCLRGFRSGPWGCEAETGTTTLLGAVYTADCSSNTTMPLVADAGARTDTEMPDFATCAMTGDEFDWVASVLPALTGNKVHRQPSPAYVKLVDDAVRLFGTMFLGLPEAAQLSQLDSLVLRLNELPFNSHRHAAVLTNILSALHAAVAHGSERARAGSGSGSGTEEGAGLSPRVARAVVEMARAGLIMPSPAHRFVAGEIIGLLATCTRDASTSYLPYLVDHLTNQAIRSRDRFARAGTAVALGLLYSRAGSIVAGRSLRQVVMLLHSLASDKDPIVHTWAIAALSEAALSAGFMFEPYARDTFQMVLKLFLSDSHTVPLHASALWLRGKEHSPPPAPADCVTRARVLPVRLDRDSAHASWSARQHLVRHDSHEAGAEAGSKGSNNQHSQNQQAQAAGAMFGSIVASGPDAALTHPNSTTHHGRAADEQQWDAGSGGDGDYLFVCARGDVDAHDARASLGRLVSSLIFVFGPELQVDGATREAVLTLLREMRRALSSAIGPMRMPMTANGASFSAIIDPDATWQTAAEYIFAAQKQLLFFPPPADDQPFLPLLMRQTLRPIVQSRDIVNGDGAGAIFALQRVAVQAMESILRLYGPRIVEALGNHVGAGQNYWADWSLCDVVWEALALHNTVADQIGARSDCGTTVQRALAADLRTLLRTAAGLVVGDVAQHQTPTLVEVLCAVFTKRSGALPAIDVGRQTSTSSSSSEYVRGAALSAIDAAADQFLTDSVRQFNSVTKQLAVAALVSVLDAVDQQRPRTSGSGTDSDKWRLHPLTPLLADLVRVGYIAATAPAAQSPTLCALGLHLIQRLVDQFRDVEDPAVRGEGVPVLAIYQAQLSSAFMPALDPQSSSVSPMLGHAAMATATAYVVSGLVAERGAMVRILRLLAPQPAFHSLVANEMKTRRRRRQLARGRASSVGSSHNENAEEPLNSTTPQMRILSRISVLHAWSVILEHALRTRNQVLLDIIAIHVPLLSQMWLSAIRDSAAIGVRPRDALDELARITGDSTFSEVSGSADIGVGLLLGLESTYVPLVRRPLAAWYRYYLPQFLSTVSLLLLGPDSSDVNGFRAMNSSIDAASRRVLEAGHTELMIRLNVVATEDAATVSLDANDLPGDLQTPIAASNGSTNTAEDDVDSLQPAASPVSVLLLVFFLQELHRLSAVSSMPKYLASLVADKIGSGDDNGVEAEEVNLTAEPPRHSCSNSVSSDPFVRRTLLRLVGVLDTTNSSSSSSSGSSSGSGTDSEAERIGDLGRAGIHVFGPTMSPDSFSIVSVRWFADMQAVRSLLRGLQALLLLEQKKRRDKRRSDTSGGADDAVAMTMHGLFVSPEVSRWLPVEFWSQAVSHYIEPLIRVNGASSSSSSLAAAEAVAATMQESGDSELARMAAHQLESRDVWIDTATMSLLLAHTMLSLFSTTMEPLPDSISSSLLPSISSGHCQTLLDQLFANGQDAGGKQLIADEGDPQLALLSVLGLSASPSSSGSSSLSSEFGAMVVSDVMGLWAASCTILRENDNGSAAASGSATRSKAVGLASACLEAMAVVAMARSLAIPQSSPRLEADGSVALPLPLLVVQLWLDLWRKSLLVYADAKSAASSVVGFIRLFPASAAGAGGKPEDGVTSTAVMRMASEMLARQLPLPNESECGSETGSLLTDNLRSGWRALNVVAWMLAMQKQKQGVEEVETEESSGVSVEVPAKLVSLFVSSYAMQLELVSKKYQQLAPSSISDGEENTDRQVAALVDLLNIPSTVCLATDGDNQGVLVMLLEMARRCIPPLGKLFYAVSSKSSNNSLEETAAAVVTTRVLQALGAFGACRFADAAGAQATSSRVMAAVLMLFLSMLPPTDSSADSGGGQWIIGEAVLNLATAQPGTFKDIVVRLSKTQPMAKRRLETAIRSHQRGSAASATAATGSGETVAAAAAAVATAAEPGASVAALSGQPSDRIVLKDTFGF